MAEGKTVFSGEKVKPGDLLVVAGSIGQAGIRRLLETKKEWFVPWFSADYLDRIWRDEELSFQKVEAEMELGAYGITGRHAVDEGGILRAVWDFSGEKGVGVSFSLRRIPVKQHVIELCERCGANPYRLWCGNCVLMAVQEGWQLVQALKDRGMEAEVIGAVQSGIAREIRHGEEIGYLERPKEDELFRLLGREEAEKRRKKICGRRFWQ